MSDAVTIPDGVEPILACRAWRVTTSAGRLDRRPTQLLALNTDKGAWARGPQKAECVSSPWSQYAVMMSRFSSPFSTSNYTNEDPRSEKHDAPGEGCQCGFWALAEPATLFNNVGVTEESYLNHVYGVVKLWGRIIPGEHGWRGQWAEVAALVRRGEGDDVEERVAETYRIPILEDWPPLTAPRVA